MCWIVISFRMNSSMTFIEEMINVKTAVNLFRTIFKKTCRSLLIISAAFMRVEEDVYAWN